MSRRFEITWIQRAEGPAQNPADEDYPYGIALDAAAGKLPACVIKLPYPAAGVGTYVATCLRCGCCVAVTTAGRVDDPTQVTIPCKETT